jgi:hypothetical protein
MNTVPLHLMTWAQLEAEMLVIEALHPEYDACPQDVLIRYCALLGEQTRRPVPHAYRNGKKREWATC